MSKKSPNILLLVMDSVRSDHVSCYGYPIETAPRIDALAATGTIFTQALSAANWTGASVTSILTGLYPSRHGYTNLNYYLDEDVVSIPQILADNGYRTVGISSNLFISSKTGLSKGFHSFYFNGQPDVHGSAVSLKKKSFLRQRYDVLRKLLPLKTRLMLKDIYDSINEERALSRDDGAQVNCELAKKWLNRRDPSQPFFMYLHFEEPHSNYFPPRPYRKRFFPRNWPAEYRYLIYNHMDYYANYLRYTEEDFRNFLTLYDGEIAYTDYRIGELLDHLRLLGILEDTVIVITADHGDLFGENGYIWHVFNLYDPLIRVPLIIHYPEWFGSGTINSQIVQSVDVLPTLLSLAGIRWPYTGENQGQTILGGEARKFSISETFNPQLTIERWITRDSRFGSADFEKYKRHLLAVRTESEKFIWASDARHEYYNLKDDPGEHKNIYAALETETELLKKGLEWSEHFNMRSNLPGHVGFDKNTWEKLKAMGYA